MNFKKMTVGLAAMILVAGAVQAKKEGAQMPPAMQAQMAKMKEVGAPGAEHAVLKTLEGRWKVTGRSWMKPGDQPQESTGKSTMEWVLDGRFLKQKYQGEWAGEEFDGLGFVGYDKMKKQYMTTWMDSMATGLFQSTGRYDAAAKTFKESGRFSCPMTGEKDAWFRSEWQIIDNDHNVYNMYMRDKRTGREFKSMELLYTRK